MEERLQKIMAQAGLGSRRDCEEYIVAGRVRVNGAVAVIGQKADPASDTISVDGRTIKPAEAKIYIALHKPKYVLSTVDAEQGDSRQTVRGLIEVSERLYPVGRLDFESEGLVLMTNDGELAQRLTHPSHGHSKEYRVLLARQPDTEQIATWQRGVVLEDGYKTQRADVRIESLAGKGAWLRIVMREGRKRQIREIGAILALPVVRIVRVRIGNLLLGNLKPGEWRYLTSSEITALKEDRPGLPAFPDMTRKNPVGTHARPQKRAPGRTAAPKEGGKATGRTRPPNEAAAPQRGGRSERTEGGQERDGRHDQAERDERRERRPAEHRSTEHKPAERRTSEHKPSEHRTSEHRPAEHRTTDRKPVERRPAEHKPSEHKPAERRPSEHKPAERKPVERKPTDRKPADRKPVARRPAVRRPK